MRPRPASWPSWSVNWPRNMSNLLDTRRRRLGSIVVPLLLISIGSLLLLQNSGLVQVSIWSLMWRAWPLIPVLVGIELLIGHQSPRVAVLVMLVVGIGAIGATALIAGKPRQLPVNWGVNVTRDNAPGESASQLPRIEEPLADVERVEVELRFGAGELRLSSLPATSGLLVAGDLGRGGGRDAPTWEVNRKREGKRAEIEIVSGSGKFGFSSDQNAEHWDLQLSPKIPVTMEVETGASDVNLDLTHLQVPTLQVKLGAAQVHLQLPTIGHTSATVEAGAADVTIEIPTDTPARIRTSGGLSHVEVDTRAFPQGDSSGVYESPGYGSSPNRVDLEVKSGLANVVVRSKLLVGQQETSAAN
ncbi:MAG: hypothetical protein CL878_06345 [Dehalococcoidia bacterium]|nr:hypothetical protein [Dehalococcoidia bacterium]